MKRHTHLNIYTSFICTRTSRLWFLCTYCWLFPIKELLYIPLQRSWKRVYWYHLVRLSVCPSVDRIVSALYLQQYSSDPFHICTSYQATSEGVSRVMPVSKFKNLKFWRIFLICNFDFVFFWLVVFGQFPPLPLPSTVQDGFFPYLVQMINSMRGCVACEDLWPWPISSRSFGLDLENRVRFVASTVLDQFFLYLAQSITIIRGCVACYIFFRIWKFELLAHFLNFSALTLKKKSTVLDGFFLYLAQI